MNYAQRWRRFRSIQIDFDTDKGTINKFVDDTVAKYSDVSSWMTETPGLTYVLAGYYCPLCGYPVRDLV